VATLVGPFEAKEDSPLKRFELSGVFVFVVPTERWVLVAPQTACSPVHCTTCLLAVLDTVVVHKTPFSYPQMYIVG
jgi:hypothetical protein